MNVKTVCHAMSAKTVSHKSAALCYVALGIVIIVCLITSAADMFMHVLIPACLDGTTSELYNNSRYNAPNADSKPYCTSDAAKSYRVPVYLYGYSGVAMQSFHSFEKLFAYYFVPFEELGPNSTCPKAISDLDSLVSVVFKDDSLQLTPGSPAFRNRLGRLESLQRPFRFHNTPVRFSSLGSKSTYYVRDLDLMTGKFKVAANTRDPPLNPAEMNSTFPYLFNSLAVFGNKECASQFKKTFRQGAGDSGINIDGTAKGSYGGICLTDEMQAAAQISIPALIGTALALLTLLTIAMITPFARIHRYFNIFFISTNVLCMILLIVALGQGTAIFSRDVASCVFGTDFSNEQLMPAATRAAVNGFTPSSGGYDMQSARTDATGRFQETQSGNAAVSVNSTFSPSYGAGAGIAAICLQFIFTIVFAKKTNWSAASEGSTSESNPITSL
jgi:hypothetical protein